MQFHSFALSFEILKANFVALRSGEAFKGKRVFSISHLAYVLGYLKTIQC